MHTPAQQCHVFETPAGFCGIVWSASGVAGFQLPSRTAEAAARHLRRRHPAAEPAAPLPEVAAAVAAACRYFAGEPVGFGFVRIDLRAPDPFFARAYAAARELAWGETTTYGALARALGAGPERARDVGQAMARNPVPLIVPCHRVLAAGGKLGGFSAPGGSATKARMLALEGVTLAPGGQASFGF
jgi:methylated-DNA-[protein]-cysteine S-methyltransferase